MVTLHHKQCFKCSRELPISEFYKHPQMADGHLNKCKGCAKRDVSENYRANIDHYVAYDKRRFQDPRRKRKLRTYAQKRSEEKRVATNMTSNAIRDGKLLRQPCEKCGAAEAEAHHDDYSRPLDVRWLCRPHHLEHHGKTSRS